MDTQLTQIASRHLCIFLTYQSVFKDLIENDASFADTISQQSHLTNNTQKEAQLLILHLQSYISDSDQNRKKTLNNIIKYPHLAISHQLGCETRLFYQEMQNILIKLETSGVILSQPAIKYIPHVIKKSHQNIKTSHQYTHEIILLMIKVSFYLNGQDCLAMRQTLFDLGYDWAQEGKKIDLQNIANFSKDRAKSLNQDDCEALQAMQNTRNALLYKFQTMTEDQYQCVRRGTELAIKILQSYMQEIDVIMPPFTC